MSKSQELLNKFYIFNKKVKGDKCLRLDKDEISIIYSALALMVDNSVDIAKEEYDAWLKEIQQEEKLFK